jgi:arylsulfatase A-like enzyme
MRAVYLVPLAWALSVAGTAAAAEAAPAARRPHIVLILADDVGWNDVGYHGSEIETPNLDRLAAEGVQLDQFYTLPGCTPTRAALLTGRYPIRYGMQEGVLWPWTPGGLPLEERTLPQALREVGYRTVMVGKWHLGMSSAEYLPLARGFDHHYGLYSGLVDYFTHFYYGGLDWHRNGSPVREQGYATNLLAREAVRIVENHDPSQPLFLYVPFNAPHAPLQVPPEYSQPYAALENPRRRTFAGMVAALDEGVGQIVDAVQRRGLAENTLILFASDNGASGGTGGSNLPLRGGKGTLYEGGVRTPALAVWPGTLPPGEEIRDPVHVVDWYVTLLALAGASREQPVRLDGFDVWPLLSGTGPSPRSQMLLNVNRTGGAIRIGSFKLIRDYGSPPRTELYDLDTDPGERRNLAPARREKVEQLEARLDVYRGNAVEPRLYPTQFKPIGFQVPAVWADPEEEPAPRRPFRKRRRRVSSP